MELIDKSNLYSAISTLKYNYKNKIIPPFHYRPNKYPKNFEPKIDLMLLSYTITYYAEMCKCGIYIPEDNLKKVNCAQEILYVGDYSIENFNLAKKYIDTAIDELD